MRRRSRHLECLLLAGLLRGTCMRIIVHFRSCCVQACTPLFRPLPCCARREGHSASPVSGEPLPHKMLMPCLTLQRCLTEALSICGGGSAE